MTALAPRDRDALMPTPRSERLDPAIWDEVVAGGRDALVSQTRRWIDAIEATSSWRDASRLYETPRGRIVVPMVRHAWTSGRGTIAASHPHGYGFGGMVSDEAVRASDVEAVLEDLSAHRALRISIRPNPLHAAAWEAAPPSWTRVTRSAQVVDLRDGADAVWKRMGGNARRAVRRAEREGVEVTCDSSGSALDAFFQLMHESRERWATQSNEPVWLARLRARHDSLARWKKMAAVLDGCCRVYLATWKGRPVAGTIVLFGPNAHYTRGAMHKQLAAQCKANYAIQWRSISDAIDAGFSAYHMGESGTSTSLARFKSQFGAATHPYAELRHESLPISAVDARARALVKRAIAFREPS
jgi:hypothetical protein